MPVAIIDGRYQFRFGPNSGISKLVHRYSELLEEDYHKELPPQHTELLPRGFIPKYIQLIGEFQMELWQNIWTWPYRQKSRVRPEKVEEILYHDTIENPSAFEPLIKGLGQSLKKVKEREALISSGEGTYTELDQWREMLYDLTASELQINLRRTSNALEEYKQKFNSSPPSKTDKLNYAIQNIETLFDGLNDSIFVFE